MSIKLCDLNPYIRCAPLVNYQSNHNPVKITDCRIFYVTKGYADILIQNQHYSLVPDSLFYCCGGSEYNIISPEGFFPICLNFDLTQVHNTFEQSCPIQKMTLPETPLSIPIFYDELENSTFLNDHFYLRDARNFFSYVKRIQTEFYEKTLYSREICSSILKELLLELHRIPHQKVPSSIDLVMKYMEANYAQDISNKTLAELAGYHEYHLNRIFLSVTGTNLHSYLIRVRLNHACRLMLNTDIPLKTISEQVGFHCYPHFSNYFKQSFGCSPNLYRNRFKESI